MPAPMIELAMFMNALRMPLLGLALGRWSSGWKASERKGDWEGGVMSVSRGACCESLGESR